MHEHGLQWTQLGAEAGKRTNRKTDARAPMLKQLHGQPLLIGPNWDFPGGLAADAVLSWTSPSVNVLHLSTGTW